MSVGSWKLERGNIATDWTPAPEDVETDINEAAKTANNYLSSDNTGIMVADMTDGNTYTPSNVPTGVKNTFIDNESFKVRNGRTVLASFGETSQIGKDTGNHQFIDAATDEVFVTDEFKKDIRKCIRKHSTHPAFGEYWFWSDVDGNKFDNFQVKYWSPLKPTFIIHK